MKKVIAIVLSLVLCLGMLAGCGGAKDDKVIKVAASPTPHALILKTAADVLAEDGWTLEVIEYTDYVVPNNVVEDGEVDANYFQHVPYLDTFNTENGTHLVSVCELHYEPFAIYPGTKVHLEELAAGDKIAVPNDGSNRARALMLLETAGLITLAEGVGMQATVLDIVDNPLELKIVEMEAAQIANFRDDVPWPSSMVTTPSMPASSQAWTALWWKIPPMLPFIPTFWSSRPATRTPKRPRL